MLNEDLRVAVEKAIQDSGYKKNWIAEQLGISKQSLYQLLNKKNLSLDDAQRVLALIGYEVKYEVIKREI